MLKCYLIYTAIASTVTFLLFGLDKALSKKESLPRIPEAVLLGISSFGGALGGLLARKLFRHKTVFKTKFHFTVGLWLALSVQVGIAVYIVLLHEV